MNKYCPLQNCLTKSICRHGKNYQYCTDFLASDASDYITGGIFAADGGGLAGGTTTTGYAPTIPIKEE